MKALSVILAGLFFLNWSWKMVFDISVAMTWILFLALFPISFVWLRRAWRIVVNRDFSEVAVKRGEAPPDPAKFAPYEMAINLVAGVILLCVIVAVLAGFS